MVRLKTISKVAVDQYIDKFCRDSHLCFETFDFHIVYVPYGKQGEAQKRPYHKYSIDFFQNNQSYFWLV